MDFWSFIKYHMVLRMVEKQFCISVYISLFIAIALWVCLGLYLLFFLPSYFLIPVSINLSSTILSNVFRDLICRSVYFGMVI